MTDPLATHEPQSNAVPLLMTGAPGWLCDVLLDQLAKEPSSAKFSVRCLVHSAIPAERLLKWRLAHPSVLEMSSGTLSNAESLATACAGMQGGVVLHAAGVIHPRRTSEWYEINRDGTLTLAKAAQNAGMRRFVFISSNAAQGVSNRFDVLMTEEMPCRPTSHYGQSKFEAEQALLKMHQPGRFEIVIARPCMFYGPPVPARHIDIFRRIQRARFPLVGGGHYARSLSYIDDLCAGLRLCLAHPAAAGEIFNLCDLRPYTTREVCDAMSAALGVQARYLPLPSFCASAAYRIDRVLASFGIYSMSQFFFFFR